MRILVPSIVDPSVHRGGAGTVTRSFMRVLENSALAAQVEYVFPPSVGRKFHRGRQLASLARSVVSALPSKALLTHSRRFRDEVLRKLRAERFDLVLINGSDLLWVLSCSTGRIPCILLAHNIEHRLFEAQIDSLYRDSSFRKAALMRDCRRLRNYEFTGMRDAKNVVFLSSDDATFATKEIPGLNSVVVPPLFDYPVIEKARPRENSPELHLGFLGNFQWWPNRHGLRWFLEKVFPHTSRDLRLHLFGNETECVESANPRIVHHGFVSDTQEIWPICDFMICPIHSGGGVNVKFAEAVYNRMPVLASSFASRGLPVGEDAGIVFRDTAEQWISFLRSPEARLLGQRRLPERFSRDFSVTARSGALLDFVQHAMDSGRAARARPERLN